MNTIDPPSGAAVSMNNNGTIIVGNVGVSKTYSIYWMEGSPPTMMRIGYLPNGTLSHANAVSGDGGIVVGYGDTTGSVNRAFRWKKDSSPEMETLEILNGYTESTARGVNHDGSVVVGDCRRAAGDTRAVRWKEKEMAAEKLRAPQEAVRCSAIATDDSGAVIVGRCDLRNGYSHAVCWLGGSTTEVTTLECLGSLSSADAYAVSSDGNVIVGSSTDPENPRITHAVRWKRNPGTNTFEISNLNVLPVPPSKQCHCTGVGSESRWNCYRCRVLILRHHKRGIYLEGGCNTQSSETRRRHRKAHNHRSL